jgi:Cu/Ag efflux protein CusF
VNPKECFEAVFFSIATNHYVDYWASMIHSANRVFKPTDQICFVVFTDDVEKCKKFTQEASNVTLKFFQIASLGWPEATLLRYELYAAASPQINAKVCAHVDADMLFFENPFRFTNPDTWDHGVALVSHPGYFRVKNSTYPITRKLKDLKTRIQIGGLGTWETRKISSAYVARKFRRSYCCGGFWMATPLKFQSLVSELKVNTETDTRRGIVARWHDESHLNFWASKNEFTELSPSYCFDASYPWLKGLPEIIRAVRKG